MHFGIAFLNDKFRFQLYVSHPDNRIADVLCITKSRTFSFDIDPFSNNIENINSIKEFVNHVNLFETINDDELYNHFLCFEKLHKNAYYLEKNPDVEINLKNIKKKIKNTFKPTQEIETEFTQKIEKYEYQL